MKQQRYSIKDEHYNHQTSRDSPSILLYFAAFIEAFHLTGQLSISWPTIIRIEFRAWYRHTYISFMQMSKYMKNEINLVTVAVNAVSLYQSLDLFCMH